MVDISTVSIARALNVQNPRIERIMKRRNELDPKIILVHLKKTPKGMEHRLI